MSDARFYVVGGLNAAVHLCKRYGLRPQDAIVTTPAELYEAATRGSIAGVPVHVLVCSGYAGLAEGREAAWDRAFELAVEARAECWPMHGRRPVPPPGCPLPEPDAGAVAA